MASGEPVHPLRLSKNSATASPSKMSSGIPRPLSELSPTAQRRNSPSWNPSAKKMGANSDSSPFQPSPVEGAASPRLFWQNRGFNSENIPFSDQSASPSSTRRASIERLQKASRVKNSNILAIEHKQDYDPAKAPQVERPLSKLQGNAFGGLGITGQRSGTRGLGHHRNESQTHIPLYSPTKASATPSTPTPAPPRSPTKEQGSPMKSSMSTTRFKSSFDREAGGWSADSSCDERQLPEGKYLQRHAKSVTFDAAPPQVNEYEMATPDLSSVGTNSREGSYESEDDDDDEGERYLAQENEGHDDSFDASLEDTDKTPVVGPEDWKHAGHDGSPMPDGAPSTDRPEQKRTDSNNSNGDGRPLPPLPPANQLVRSQSNASAGLSATAERMVGQQRILPSPPAASTSKSDIQNIGNAKMTLEERLKLMMLSDDGKSAAEQQRERRMRRAGTPRDRVGSPTPEREIGGRAAEEEDEADDTIGDLSGLGEYQIPPKISRESILRRVNGNKPFERESDYNFSSPAPSSPERQLPYDPDVAIPSTEEDSMVQDDGDNGSVIVTRDSDQREVDIDAIPTLSQRTDSALSNRGHKTDEADYDSGSDYAEEVSARQEPQGAVPIPRAATPTRGLQIGEKAPKLEAYALPKPYDTDRQRPQTPLSKPEYDGSGWGDPENEYEDEPSTPDSVIHHPMHDFDEHARDSPVIPEQVATIKSSSGSKLKTRPSVTPSDIEAMREARRQVSREIVPPIPERHRNRTRDMDENPFSASDDFVERHPSFKKRSLTLDLDLGLSLDQDFERVIEAQKVAFQELTPCQPKKAAKPQTATVDRSPTRQASRKIEAIVSATDVLDTNITSRKQRGYLMRQNTKLVAASDNNGEDLRGGYRSAGNSPVKGMRPQSWTVEPWNGQIRKKSLRKGAPNMPGPVPPLPGQESNATAMNTLTEEDLTVEMAPEDSGERGRLFVKVMGVKDLDLPIPKTERTWFSLTLDNGVHCVTTAWLELARNAPIGQEFELVVPNDLEFQLTLNVKLEPPAPSNVPQSPTKSSKPKSVSTFSRVFASPKKRKEMEQRHREEEERFAQEQRELQIRQANTAPNAWELLSPLAAEDGSFARSYVCLKEHESRCFGRPYLVEVAAFNEWAAEEAGFASSVKSKRAGTVVRRAPYKIGKLELQLLFVPRPKGATDEAMPKSMNSCIRELKAAEERLSRNWEGHLSQQGGDCPYWRRRYFKLVGTKLTAYHEATRQPRATINLSNAKRLIDDRRALTEKETIGRGGKRRRSGFAEEEEGYMFVEEGFRIRFNNGEVIDFYADSTADKDGWMKVLGEVVGRDSLGSGGDGGDHDSSAKAKGRWCELVLKREETLRRRAQGRRVHSRTKSMNV